MKPARVLRDLRPAAAGRVLAVPNERPASPKGFDEGYREGVQVARREAEQLLLTAQAHLDKQRAALEQQYRQRLDDLDALITRVNEAQTQARLQQEQAVVTLAYEALLRILHDAHDSRPMIARIVSQALHEAPPGELNIRLHPADHARLLADEALQALLGARVDVRCIADESLKPGDCLIDTTQGSRELGLATQLRELTQAWLGALGALGEQDEGIRG